MSLLLLHPGRWPHAVGPCWRRRTARICGLRERSRHRWNWCSTVLGDGHLRDAFDERRWRWGPSKAGGGPAGGIGTLRSPSEAVPPAATAMTGVPGGGGGPGGNGGAPGPPVAAVAAETAGAAATAAATAACVGFSPEMDPEPTLDIEAALESLPFPEDAGGLPCWYWLRSRLRRRTSADFSAKADSSAATRPRSSRTSGGSEEDPPGEPLEAFGVGIDLSAPPLTAFPAGESLLFVVSLFSFSFLCFSFFSCFAFFPPRLSPFRLSFSLSLLPFAFE